MGVTEFAAALREAMERAGVNQTELGEVAGASQAMINNWLAGKTANPDPGKVFDAERALKLSPGDLSQYLGFLPASEDEAAEQPVSFRGWLVAHGDELTPQQCQLLEGLYEEFVTVPLGRPRKPITERGYVRVTDEDVERLRGLQITEDEYEYLLSLRKAASHSDEGDEQEPRRRAVNGD